MIIQRNAIILDEYTDDALTTKLTDPQPGVRRRAAMLLSAPPEYRQGVEAAVHQQATVTRWIPPRGERTISMAESVSTGVSPEDARAMALLALANQGVTLLPAPSIA